MKTLDDWYVAPLLLLYWYGAVPPFAVKVMVPLLPVHILPAMDELMVMGNGSLILKIESAVQPFASVTVML